MVDASLLEGYDPLAADTRKYAEEHPHLAAALQSYNRLRAAQVAQASIDGATANLQAFAAEYREVEGHVPPQASRQGTPAPSCPASPHHSTPLLSAFQGLAASCHAPSAPSAQSQQKAQATVDAEIEELRRPRDQFNRRIALAECAAAAVAQERAERAAAAAAEQAHLAEFQAALDAARARSQERQALLNELKEQKHRHKQLLVTAAQIRRAMSQEFDASSVSSAAASVAPAKPVMPVMRAAPATKPMPQAPIVLGGKFILNAFKAGDTSAPSPPPFPRPSRVPPSSDSAVKRNRDELSNHECGPRGCTRRVCPYEHLLEATRGTGL
jgi:hypothetical protein